MRRITVHSCRTRKYLHPDDGVDKEEHHDEQSYMRESLRTEHGHSHTRGQQNMVLKRVLMMEARAADLERLDEGPQQVTDSL